MSNAYTVKSLPGAYLYIPVVDATNNHHSPNLQSVPSLPSVKRALSDPQIHFSSPIGAHPIILTVNPSSAEGMFSSYYTWDFLALFISREKARKKINFSREMRETREMQKTTHLKKNYILH